MNKYLNAICASLLLFVACNDDMPLEKTLSSYVEPSVAQGYKEIYRQADYFFYFKELTPEEAKDEEIRKKRSPSYKILLADDKNKRAKLEEGEFIIEKDGEINISGRIFAKRKKNDQERKIGLSIGDKLYPIDLEDGSFFKEKYGPNYVARFQKSNLSVKKDEHLFFVTSDGSIVQPGDIALRNVLIHQK